MKFIRHGNKKSIRPQENMFYRGSSSFLEDDYYRNTLTQNVILSLKQWKHVPILNFHHDCAIIYKNWSIPIKMQNKNA